MVNKLADRTDKPIVFTSKVAYLSKEENRLCVIVPKSLRGFINKGAIFQVVLRPLGSITA